MAASSRSSRTRTRFTDVLAVGATAARGSVGMGATTTRGGVGMGWGTGVHWAVLGLATKLQVLCRMCHARLEHLRPHGIDIW